MLRLIWILMLTLSYIACVKEVPPETIPSGAEEFSRSRRLFSGDKVKTGEVPYQVFLRQDGILICAGALISFKHVLTAAHCVCGVIDEPYEKLIVLTGITSRDVAKSNNFQKGRMHQVKSVTCHPGYRYGVAHSWADDVAVITLMKYIPRSYVQSPIALPSHEIRSRTSCIVAGWGHMHNAERYSGFVEKMSVGTLSNLECQKHYNNTILQSQICTLGKNNTALCKGDSGTPLVANGMIFGIFSWTMPCNPKFPQVYTRVYQVKKFIENVLREK